VITSFAFDLLEELMRDDIQKIGCIVMSGENTTLYTVAGTEIITHASIDVNLPNKHGRGGQSKSRFERLADEARHNYISKVIETVLKVYTPNDSLIVGGSAELKDKMSERLKETAMSPKILKVSNIQHDKREGLYELLQQSNEVINSVGFEQERLVINEFMKSLDTNLGVYGENSVNYCLHLGLIKILVVYKPLASEQLHDICNNYGTELITIADYLPESIEFRKGFGEIVGILRYSVEIPDEIN
jgi:peptide chain release factor subunit 1